MHLDAKSNHIFLISNFYAFRLFIDYRKSIVQLKRRFPLFDNHVNFDLLRLDSSVRRKTRKCAKVT